MTTTDRGAPSGGRQSQMPSRLTRPIQVCPAAAFPKPVICPKDEIYLTTKKTKRQWEKHSGATLEENQKQKGGREKR